jgi:ATP-dependent helicase HrpB
MPLLPIHTALPALDDALATASGAVLQAPPGAGKTTVVPLAVLDRPWLAGRRIVMLEPRRLAARAAARRMAATLGERVGETVGYRVRLDTRVGPRTRIEVVTEGILTRFLQDDPALEPYGLVIFDEFHERSLHADLGLALTLQTQSLLRPDLRILLMSATLDGAAAAALLGGVPVVTSEGRSHPVETRYQPRRPDDYIEPAVAAAAREALGRDRGDILVFLPGTAEIRRTEALLAAAELGAGVRIAPLHGSLPQPLQDAALEPSPPGRRKIVLATSIAETSLTIEGIGVVVDSGLSRVPRFSPRTGMTRLETVRVTRASAEQRRGRAGRLGPGVCYRLWAEHEEAALLPHGTPEILEADLAPLALELARAGIRDAAELRWLDPPPGAALAHARELLAALGALDAGGRITEHGRRMATLPLHPRLAHLVLAAEPLGLSAMACELAALLQERDILRGDGGAPEADLRLRLDALAGAAIRGHTVDRDGARRVRAEADALRRQLRLSGGAAREVESAGLLLAFAYPDRIAQRRAGTPGRFLLRNGRGATLEAHDPIAAAPYLVAAELDGRGTESRIYLAAPVDEAELARHFGDQIVEEATVAWDTATEAVRGRRRTRLGALVLADAPLRDPDPDEVRRALAAGIREAGPGALPWTDAARRAQQRLGFLHRLDPTWPDVSDAALVATLDDWLGPHLAGLRRLDEVRRLDLAALLEGMLDWRQRAELDRLAPTHVTVPSGSRIPIDYGDAAAPVLAVRLQEMFGATETPRVAGGAVPLTLHLLSPAHRPMQVTQDLAGFWQRTYFDVRKDLKGRYPKHHWPDDPLAAPATRRAKRRGE